MSEEVRGTQDLESVTDKSGRRFTSGEGMKRMPGVKVESVRRTGNFVTVAFGPAVEHIAIPKPIVLHINDVAGFKPQAGVCGR